MAGSSIKKTDETSQGQGTDVLVSQLEDKAVTIWKLKVDILLLEHKNNSKE